jgi:hypothetical protein
MRLPRPHANQVHITQKRDEMNHNRHISSAQWEHAIGYARQMCARIFRDGGTPCAALKAFGLNVTDQADWSTAVDRIALALCTWRQRKAA